jgi:hypothetical protein
MFIQCFNTPSDRPDYFYLEEITELIAVKDQTMGIVCKVVPGRRFGCAVIEEDLETCIFYPDSYQYIIEAELHWITKEQIDNIEKTQCASCDRPSRTLGWCPKASSAGRGAKLARQDGIFLCDSYIAKKVSWYKQILSRFRA